MSFNSAFDVFVYGVMNGSIDLNTDDFRAYLLATGGGGTTAEFTFNKALTGMNHPQIPTGQNRVGPVQLQNVTAESGIFNCDPFTFLSVPSGSVRHAVLIYKHVTNGEAVTDIPCLYYANGIPATANGNNVVVSANAAAGLVSGQSQ